MTPFILNVHKSKSVEIKLIDSCLGLQLRTGLTVNAYERSHWGDGSILKLDYADGYTTH